MIIANNELADFPTGSLPIQNKWNEILRFFPVDLQQLLAKVPSDLQSEAIEIRLRIKQPLELNLGNKGVLLSAKGEPVNSPEKAFIISAEEVKRFLNSITNASYYALEDEFAQGYLTLPGGHRVGFTGYVLQDRGRIRLIRNISSLNFRIAKAIRGIAKPILPLLWKGGRFLRTLIISPPAAGKTTLLREIIRQVSYGNHQLNIPALHVGLVDERSEIAGSYQGVSQLDVGPFTDILDGAPKKEGIYLLLRAMNPQLIATDEIGTDEDVVVIRDIINAGVSFIATAHARDLTDVMLRPGLKQIMETGSIERLIFLSNRLGAGTVESIKAGVGAPELLPKAFRLGGNHV